MFPVLAGSNPSGYNLTRSLRFRSSASAYLNRTPITPVNQPWTLSLWIKRGKLGAQQAIIQAGTNGTNDTGIYFTTNDTIDFYTRTSGTILGYISTVAVYRDPSAWYHMVFVYNAQTATAANRMQIYVNNILQTVTVNNTLPQNTASWINSVVLHTIGELTNGSAYLDGYLAEVNFIDGQALTPSSFGSTNATTGVWQPARYGGTYGTNGFYLPFTNNTSPTTLGYDFSGNGNNWTVNNISLDPSTRQSFTTVGTTSWTAPAGVTSVQYLVVAGGGAGGGGVGAYFGGGGAGGLLTGYATVVPGQTYNITVGAGGTGGSGTGTNGGDSSFGSFATATGGGFGGTFYTTVGNGGSGGGGFFNGGSAGTGIAGQGYIGGTSSTLDSGGGGGGAGGAGGYFVGGAGVASSITGGSVTYAAGGYAGFVVYANANGGNGTANTGNGGGGASGSGTGGNGGSGIVVLAYGAGTTYDSMTDVPTLTSATAANFAVVNPLQSYYTPTNGNLTFSTGANSTGLGFSSIGLGTGVKFYFEATATGSAQQIGIFSSNQALTPTGSKRYWYLESGGLYNDGTLLQSVATFTSGDTIAVAWDGTAQTVTFYKNNTQQGTAISVDTSYSYFFGVGAYNGGWNVNFGQRPFAYTPPTGYVALNTYNLPTTTIVKGNTVMDATLYTGNGSTQTITNAATFKPDLVWVKGRSSSQQDHTLVDSVRGVSRRLRSNATTAEVLESGYNITAFNSNGFTVVDDTAGSYNVNGSVGGTYSGAAQYVGWQWQAGQGTTSSNTSGSITSTVSVNASAGFSIVSYTGTGANATVGHGLGVAPQFIITKNRSATSAWHCYVAAISNMQNGYIVLNSDAAFSTSTNTVWNGTQPTSSVFSVGTDAGVNGNGNSEIAYCWTPIAGYSAFGSYTGNGSTDGPFVYTGFKPKFVLIKGAYFASNWFIEDAARNGYNVNNGVALRPNLSGAEDGTTTYNLDLLSNGFKLRSSAGDSNTNGSVFIYMAFAENPFKNALAR